MEEIKPIAMPGTHKNFLKHFKKLDHPTSTKILDVGAGHGAFTKVLFELGYQVEACDLFPEIFMFDKVKCKKADITKQLPYTDNSFDIVIAVEVSEHILDHEVFFSEVNRILKPKGQFYLSTPNILSMKSRLRFFMSGFFYSFGKLDLNNNDGLQHTASLSLDQYNYVAVRNGFKTAKFEIDRKQSTSKWIFYISYPLILLYKLIKRPQTFHNNKKLILGRLLFLNFESEKIDN